MDTPYWTVGNIRDALGAFALLHQHSFVVSILANHATKELEVMVKEGEFFKNFHIGSNGECRPVEIGAMTRQLLEALT